MPYIDGHDFKFILSKEKFAEIGAEDKIDDTVYSATLINDDYYLVKWEEVNELEGIEYSKQEIEKYIKKGYWVKLEDEN